MLTITAPAKINLTLEVLSKHADGFHEIKSVIQTINLCDRLHFGLSSNLAFQSDIPGWQPEKSLVSKATHLLRETAGGTSGAKIEIEKFIPLFSGLGGDSSDAAATLIGLNRLWGLGLPKEALLKIAEKLGSDVPFFIYGGTVLASGRGEVVTSLPPFPHMWLVLLLPPLQREAGKTGRLYARLKPFHYTKGEATDRLVALLNSGEIKRAGILKSLFNVFEKFAFDYFQGLEKYWQQFLGAGAKNVHLSGSGPALFTMTQNKSEAERIYTRLKEQGLSVYLTDTLEVV